MPRMPNMKYIDFPVEKLVPQPGTLTWLCEFEGDPVTEAALEFPVPHQPIAGDEEYEAIIDADRGTNLTVEFPIPHMSEAELDGFQFTATGEASQKFGGSIYLQSRHHGIDVRSASFQKTDDGILSVTVNCRLFFTHEGLSGGENIEYADVDWTFSAPLSVQERVHNFRAGKRPSLLGNITSRLGLPKGQ